MEELRNKLIDLYYRQALPITEICEALDIGRGTFYNLMKKFGLPLKETRTGPMLSSPACPRCGTQNSVILMAKADPYAVTRVRKCKKCGTLFKTKEVRYGKEISAH